MSASNRGYMFSIGHYAKLLVLTSGSSHKKGGFASVQELVRSIESSHQLHAQDIQWVLATHPEPFQRVSLPYSRHKRTASTWDQVFWLRPATAVST